MFNLFKSKKETGKPSTKSSSKRNTNKNRTGTSDVRSSWFAKPSRPNRNQRINIVEIRPISESSPALNNNNNNENKKSKRPVTVFASNVTLRRGQSSKIEGQTPEELSRASSITNINAEQKGKGAKPKKAESKDKLDKVGGGERKNDRNRATLTKNNNKESSLDNDPATEVDYLQKQLIQMANDKTNLELQLGERNVQLGSLQNELVKLKMLQDESNQKVEQLSEENTILRNRLRDVAHSPLSDNEKQQLLYESHRHHSSAPASIATNLLDDGGDITACPTPEWDKHSSSNVSEVSVACLQDKINQMQETHYSTNEELQATLQELTDLQKQLTELQQENLRLNEEKNLMFESLCRQTERLNDSRNEVESLKQLLYKDESGQFESAAEREQKLVDLLKSAQEEREALLMKQEQLGNDLEDSRSANLIHNDEIAQLSERVKTLESTLDAKHAEHKLLDQELALAKDQSSSRQIEINRLKDLLENARTKINELEQDRALSDKSELDELLDNARKEKDALESEVAHLKEQLALSRNETEKLKEQVSILQEECKVTRNNAKTTQSDLEYKVDKLLMEKNALSEQLQQFQEAVNELQVQAQCQSDDKRQLSAVLSETQRNLNESERKIVTLENELSELKRVKQEQEEDWEKFQNDLLTSVRVANDFKTEAQQDLQKLIMENKAGRERIKQLEAQIEKLKGGRRKSPHKLTNEEMLMASLNRRYKEIENLTDDQLSEEQKAIKVLKSHYDYNVKAKPVAPKPKDKLAISKPSLDSVISNPKLDKIVKDPKLPSVEIIVPQTLSDDEEGKNRNVALVKVHSDSALPAGAKEEIIRSRSMTDLDLVVLENDTQMRRYNSTANLLDLPKEFANDYGKKFRNKSVVTFDTLNEICNGIDPNTPEDQLTKEQRLALRLKEVLGKGERKSTLRRNLKIGRKKVVISRPTPESVRKNDKLLLIIEDPKMQDVTKRMKSIKKTSDRYSMPVTMEQKKNTNEIVDKSKSYNDISFRFVNMYCDNPMVADNGRSFDFDKVLPPEPFRDSPPRNSVILTTFQGTDTFKKEHNYLEIDAVDEAFKAEKSDEDPKLQYTVNEVLIEGFRPEEDPVIDEGPKLRYSVNEVFIECFEPEESKDRKMDENGVDEVSFEHLEPHEDQIEEANLDDEEVTMREGIKKRYSKVVQEIKIRFSQIEETKKPIKELSAISLEDLNAEEMQSKEDLEDEKNLVIEEITSLEDKIKKFRKKPIIHLQDSFESTEEDTNDYRFEEIVDIEGTIEVSRKKPIIQLQDSFEIPEERTNDYRIEEIIDDEDLEFMEQMKTKYLGKDGEDNGTSEEEFKDAEDSLDGKWTEPHQVEKEEFSSTNDISKFEESEDKILPTDDIAEESNLSSFEPMQMEEGKKEEILLILDSGKETIPQGEEIEDIKDDAEASKVVQIHDLSPFEDENAVCNRQDLQGDEELKKIKEIDDFEVIHLDTSVPSEIGLVKMEENEDKNKEILPHVEFLRKELKLTKMEEINTKKDDVSSAILPPTALGSPTSYEPVYVNCFIATNNNTPEITPFSGKKPIATPRSTNEPIYEDLSGQIRKTRFSISYQRKEIDFNRTNNDPLRNSVRDLRNVFEKNPQKEDN